MEVRAEVEAGRDQAKTHERQTWKRLHALLQRIQTNLSDTAPIDVMRGV
jgi:hypothetical protein